MHTKLCRMLVALLLLAGIGATSAEASRHRAKHVQRTQEIGNPFSIFDTAPKQAARHSSRKVRAAAEDSDFGLLETRPQRSNHRHTGRGLASIGLGSMGLGTSGLGPRPAQWCGWWMRSQLGGGPEYNLAANWRRYGSPSSPHVGAVVVWPHHVGIITGQAANGKWIVKSGNYGGRVAEVARSIAGAVVRA